MSQISMQNNELPAAGGKLALFGVLLIAAILIASFAILIVNSRNAPGPAAAESAQIAR